jgi:predicted nicotinamide N-methyase
MSNARTAHRHTVKALWDQARVWRRSGSEPVSASGPFPSRREELLHQIASIGPLRVDPVDLPGCETPLQITHTADFERLLDNSVYDFATDYMPYWAEIWPCGVVLAGFIAREPDGFHGRRVLELGPGVGVTAVAAMRAGADLVLADFAPGSLALSSLNALDQVGVEPKTLLVNWREPSAELLAAAGDGFAIVLAADVLYEERDVKPLARLLKRLVAPGGEVWIAEPGRDVAQLAVEALRRRGWRGASEQCVSPRPDPNYPDDPTLQIITVHRLRRPVN